MNMSVMVSIHVDKEITLTSWGMIRGGLKVSVNGERISQYSNEDEETWVFDWHPEFVGDHIASNLLNFIRALISIKKRNVSFYERIEVEVEPTISYFVLEPLSEDHLRIAFQSRVHADDDLRTLPPRHLIARACCGNR